MSITSYLFKYVTKKKGGGSGNLLSLEEENSQPQNRSTKYCTIKQATYNILYRVASLPIWWRGSNDLIDNCHIQGLNIWKYHVTHCRNNAYGYMARGVNGHNITESITDNKEK